MTDVETVLTGRRVLVLEDEYYLADDLRSALERLGAVVVGPVPTQQEAFAHISSGDPIELVVLDINLRGEKAFPIADALAERGVPFVFATGYEPESVPERYAWVPHWQKPFEARVLARSLGALMAR